MLNGIWALLVAGVPTLISIWLIPIWRSARRTDFTMAIPLEYKTKSVNGAIFRGLQWLFWGQPPMIVRLAEQAEFLRNSTALLSRDRHVAVQRLSVVIFVPFPRTSAAFVKFFDPKLLFWFLGVGLFVVITALADWLSRSGVNSVVVWIPVGILLLLFVMKDGLDFFSRMVEFSRNPGRLFAYLSDGRPIGPWAYLKLADEMAAAIPATLRFSDDLPESVRILGYLREFCVVRAHYEGRDETVPVLSVFGFFLALAHAYDGLDGVRASFAQFLDKIRQEEEIGRSEEAEPATVR